MLLFLFFLVFLLHDVQLVIPGYGIVLYRFRNCSDCLQILLYYFRTCCCLCARCCIGYIWYLQNLQGNLKNQKIEK